jgi:hypothetical protein
MEINTNINSSGGIDGVTRQQRSKVAANAVVPDGSFASSTALEGALKQVPDARPEAIARARELINDPQYPSADTIKKLSNFLAAKLTSSQD